jgi:hypothetical protein
VIGVEGREIVRLAAAELGVFLEQPLLDVEAEMLRLVVGVVRIDLLERKRSALPLANSTSNSVLPR